jgi:hypothetical protein
VKLGYTLHMTGIIASVTDLSSCVYFSLVVTEHTNKINQVAKEIYYYRFNVLTAVDKFCIYITHLEKKFIAS